MKKLYTIKNSKLHGKGLFANSNIKSGSNIIEYVWKLLEIHSKASNKSVVFQKKNLGFQGMYVT